MSNYDDIINLPHPTSKTHPRMSAISRAAQFGAFRALTGHEEAITEVARITEKEPLLNENAIAILNNKLNILLEKLNEEPSVTITFFNPDKKKDGGEYIIKIGKIKKLDNFSKQIIMDDKTLIPIYSILEIESEIFDEIV